MEQPVQANLATLVEQHHALLYRFAFRLTGSVADAEDLVQQTYLTAQTKLGQLRAESCAKSWLCTILRNHFCRQIRDQHGLSERSLEVIAEPEMTPVESAIDQDHLQQCLNELPVEFRETVTLFYFGEFSYREIAEQLNIATGTVMSRLSRGKALLRQKLEFQPVDTMNKP